jgi:hypothetical protein
MPPASSLASSEIRPSRIETPAVVPYCIEPMASPADRARRDRRIDALIGRLPGRLQSSLRRLRRREARWIRLPVGLLLVLGGIFSILPLLGLWMLPLGLILLAEDLPIAGRLLDRLLDWLARHRPAWLGETRE